MTEKFSQKGIVFLPIIIVLVVIVSGVIAVKSGVLKLTAQPSSPSSIREPSPTPKLDWGFSNLESSGQEIEESPEAIVAEELSFVNYSSSEYGYSLSHPKGWSVENVPAKDHREIKVKEPNGRAFVLIAAYKDDRIGNEVSLEEAIASRENAVRSSASRIDNFEKTIQDDIGGYIATGVETFDNFTVVFQERGLFGTTGKIILFHGAVVPDFANDYDDVITQIIESFQLI